MFACLLCLAFSHSECSKWNLSKNEVRNSSGLEEICAFFCVITHPPTSYLQFAPQWRINTHKHTHFNGNHCAVLCGAICNYGMLCCALAEEALSYVRVNTSSERTSKTKQISTFILQLPLYTYKLNSSGEFISVDFSIWQLTKGLDVMAMKSSAVAVIFALRRPLDQPDMHL